MRVYTMKPRNEELAARILAELSIEDRSARFIANKLGVSIGTITNVLITLFKQGRVGRQAPFKVGERHSVFVWSANALMNGKPVVNKAETPVYRSAFACALGEPPLGRSALDARMRGIA